MKGGGGREREEEMGKGGICAFVIFHWEKPWGVDNALDGRQRKTEPRHRATRTRTVKYIVKFGHDQPGRLLAETNVHSSVRLFQRKSKLEAVCKLSDKRAVPLNRMCIITHVYSAAEKNKDRRLQYNKQQQQLNLPLYVGSFYSFRIRDISYNSEN